MTDQQKERLRQIHSLEGFIKEWKKLVDMGYRATDALDLLNEEYETYFGERRYSDYSSFAVAKSRKEKAK
jgi:hypothetical protein